MKAAPKFSGSVEARVRLTISKLQSEEIYVSAQCTAVVKMFRNLVSEKPGKTYDPNISFKPKRSIYLHAFDAMTYPIMYNESNHYVSVGESRSTEIMDLGGF
jgi:hypothetical protein